MESAKQYSNRPGAETCKLVFLFWKPQHEDTSAQEPVSNSPACMSSQSNS